MPTTRFNGKFKIQSFGLQYTVYFQLDFISAQNMVSSNRGYIYIEMT